MTTIQTSKPDAADGVSSSGRDSGCADAAIRQLMLLQKHRVIAMRQQLRVRNAALATIRVCAGFRWDAPEKERKAICTQAERILEHVWRGKPCKPEDESILGAVGGPVLTMRQSYEPWGEALKLYERNARKLARSLPIRPWVDQEQGVNPDTIAAVLGETGNPSDYPRWKRMARRMGLMPYKGKMGATWRASKPTLTAEEWAEYGYSGRRRAIIHNIANAFKKNYSEPYRTIYDEWKAYELGRTDDNAPKSNGHADRRALLIAGRVFVQRLWWAWRKAEQGKLDELLTNDAA